MTSKPYINCRRGRIEMFNDKEVGFVIQARLGSTRLPAKALLYYRGTTILGYIIQSLLDFGISHNLICVATSSSPLDDVLNSYLTEIGCRVVRGSEDNVFSRYQRVALETGFKNMVRLTGDNPSINTELLMHCVKSHLRRKSALTTTRKIEGTKVIRYVPKGLSVDVINSDFMLSIDNTTLNKFEMEHVIPIFFKKFNVQLIRDFSVSTSDASIDTLDDYARLF
jgi:spore coat polysaccharide biosynthesis protein SpsF